MSWAGYYDPGKRDIVVDSTPDYLPVLRHESNHSIVDTAFDEGPVWLREGLAEYFETASAKPEGLVVVDQPRHRRAAREAIHEFLASLKNQRGLYSPAALDRSCPGSAAAFEREWLGFVEARGKAE